MTDASIRSAHKGQGHRGRLRDRFLQGGLDSFLDYEIVELILTFGTPRKDCKDMAKQAIQEFGSLGNVLNASIEDLQKIDGVGPTNAFGIKFCRAISERVSKDQMPNRMELRSTASIAKYLQKSIGPKQVENFVALYLDSANRLMDERLISVGILNMSLAHPREVFSPAISLRASAVIVAHNHPSGKIEPSREDREVTKQLIEAGRIMGIELRDHIIVSTTAFLSFRQELLM